MTRVSDRYLETRRQEILDAARAVFVEKGYAAATMNDIATEAGVAAGSIYRYFAGKADLIAEVAGSCVQEYMERWQVEVESATPGEALLRLGEVTREDFHAVDHLAESMLRMESYLAASREPALREQMTGSLDQSTGALAEFILRAQRSGEFDASYDAADLSRFLHAAASGIGALSIVYGERLDTDRLWDLLMRLVSQCFTDDFERGEGSMPSATARGIG